MRTLYIDCGMGAAGDMLTAALLELTEDPEKTIKELNELHVPHVRFEKESSVKCGIRGTHIRVIVDGREETEQMHDHEHEGHTHDYSHHGLHGIERVVRDHLAVNENVKRDILEVYHLLAEAESRVHNTPVEEIHFHELGTADALADITAVCWLMDQLKPDEVLASPVHVGKGTVRCAHGILPVPAPATALLLEGIPVYSRDEVDGELCTPTGAALLKRFVSHFGSMPELIPEKIGYGMGKKDFPIANCVRVFLAESNGHRQDTVRELDFNVDDMTGEEIGFATEKLLEAGAREVFVTPVYMKKGRPGSLITVLCTEETEDLLIHLIFRHTTTIGIRCAIKERFVLERTEESQKTPFGPVRWKKSSGYGVVRVKAEHEDLAKIAREQNMSIREVLEIMRGEMHEE